MNSSNISLPGAYFRLIVEIVTQRGIEPSQWLPALGLDEAMLEQEQLALEWETFYQFILTGNQIAKDPLLGFVTGERLIVNTHGILGYAAISATSLREVIQLFQRFMPLRTDLVTVEYTESGSEFRVILKENRNLDQIRHHITETIILALKNVLDFVTMGNSGVAYVAFPFAVDESYKVHARHYLRSEVRYEQNWTGFVLPIEVVDKPLNMANPSSYQEAIRICETELEKLVHHTSLGGKVRRLMLESYANFPSLEATAQRFYMTPRTLHRRLQEEGQSYKQILEEVRHSLAIKYLQGGQMNIQEIAFALGYSDIANFRRAFKRWEGVAPSQFVMETATSQRGGLSKIPF